MAIAAATTNFKAATAAFTGDVEAAKTELANLNNQVSTLQHQRLAIENALPHTEDIVAMFQRGLAASNASFEQQLKAHLQDTFERGAFVGAAAKAVKGKGRDLLSIGTAAADRDMVRAREGGRPWEMPLSVAAVTYFLRDDLAAELPALVARLLPSSATGMKAADRVQQLQALDIQIADLQAQAAALNETLNAARAALRGGRG